MGSYTSQTTNAWALVHEARTLYRLQGQQAATLVGSALEHVHRVERVVDEHYGFKMEDLDVLDIGAGQFLFQMHWFGQHNRVVGIDFDVIAQGFSPGKYLEMLRFNGPRRTAKTIARKLLGIDRKCRNELMSQLGVPALTRREVLRMDACNMAFEPGSFDFVHCLSVFHHLPRPEAAIQGIRRVLRPGGVAYVSFHLYTSETGSLDPRVMGRHDTDLPRWAHLRPEHSHLVRTNAYLNKLCLQQWREVFEAHMPGAILIPNPTSRSGADSDAQALRESGELADYSAEELLTHSLGVVWQKPESFEDKPTTNQEK